MWDALTGRLGQRVVCLAAIGAILACSDLEWLLILCVMSLALIVEFLAYIQGVGDGVQSVIQMPPDRVDEIRRILKDNDDK